VIRAYCLAHARRKVFELKDDYPAECEMVLDAVGKVYEYEAELAEPLGRVDRVAPRAGHAT